MADPVSARKARRAPRAGGGIPLLGGRRGRRGVLATCALALVLAACATSTRKVCPRTAILDEAGSLTRFADPGATSPQDVVVQADMVGIESDCTYRGESHVDLESNFTIEIAARRGPALRGDAVDVDYFVVITDRAGTVLAKRVFPLHLAFGQRRTLRVKEHTWQYYRLEGGTSGASYEIWTGFQLSDAELEFNRQRARR